MPAAAAKTAGYNSDDCALATAEAYRYAKDLKKSLEVLDKLSGAVEQTAEYLALSTKTLHGWRFRKLQALLLNTIGILPRRTTTGSPSSRCRNKRSGRPGRKGCNGLGKADGQTPLMRWRKPWPFCARSRVERLGVPSH